MATISVCNGIDGQWQGAYTDCATVNCVQPVELGACCIDGLCVDSLSLEVCDQNGGQWQGASLTCATSDCSTTDARSACCINDGCLMELESDCLSVDGDYYQGASCGTVTCPTRCLGDLDGDGIVKVADLLILLAAWGICP